MAKWTISEYATMPVDAAGAFMPISRKPMVPSTGVTAAGNVNLNGGRYVRFIGDTPAHVAIGHQATTSDEYVPGATEYWVDPEGAAFLSFIVG